MKIRPVGFAEFTESLGYDKGEFSNF